MALQALEPVLREELWVYCIFISWIPIVNASNAMKSCTNGVPGNISTMSVISETVKDVIKSRKNPIFSNPG
jgi:hypothetical protein